MFTSNNPFLIIRSTTQVICRLVPSFSFSLFTMPSASFRPGYTARAVVWHSASVPAGQIRRSFYYLFHSRVPSAA